jgi:hypothetical protein
MEYTEFQLDGQAIGGMMPMGDMFPPEVPPHWLVYFAVQDCDATLASARDLGATVLAPPRDIPVGRFAVMADPQRAAFAFIALAPQD